MRRLLKFVFQLVAVAIVFFLLTAATIVVDGQTDRGDKAEAALVTSHAHPGEGKTDPLLDRVIELYKAGKVSTVMVVGTTWREMGDENAGTMVKYLVAHGIPESAILESNEGGNTEETTRVAAQMIQSHSFESVMIVADYYDITRLKLGLKHEGVVNIENDHIGGLRKEDAVPIGRSVVTLYGYVGRVYLMPAAETVQKEAKIGMDKASADAEHAKEKVDKGLDSLAK